MPTNSNSNQNESIIYKTEPAYKAALEARKEKLYALSDAEVAMRPRLDAGAAAGRAEANAVNVQPYRAALVAEFGEPAGELVDELAPAARAAKQADIEHARAHSSGAMAEHYAKVNAQYDLLMTDAQSLVNRKHLSERDISAARDIQNPSAKNKSLLILVSVFREHWARIKDQTPITAADVDEAERVAQEANTEIAYRDHGVTRLPTAELRNRALTRLVIVNESIRRMMTYLRWNHGDADEIVPSFWAGRARGKRADESGPGGPTEPAPAEPGANGPTGPAAPEPSDPPFDPTGDDGPFTP